MAAPVYALGLDFSTQSATAVVADLHTRRTIWSRSLGYLSDARLARARGDLVPGAFVSPPGEPGEANQPAALFLAALDAVLDDMSRALPAASVASIGVSAQQHAHALMSAEAPALFAALREAPGDGQQGLPDMLHRAFVLPWMRIWKTSCTIPEADYVRGKVGGSAQMVGLTGSDAPARFSAFGIRRTALKHPEAYAACTRVHHLSSLLSGVLCGNADAPLDFGEACGSSLMDYSARCWSTRVAEAVADGLPGGAAALLAKLPQLASGTSVAGKLATYFCERYGMSRDCLVSVGSGDNPQTKVLVPGTALSLGSSFVLMAEGGADSASRLSATPGANGMYDGLDRAFSFCCRTNGALRWDDVRNSAEASLQQAEAALAAALPSPHTLFLWHRERESFPPSQEVGPLRQGYTEPSLARDYSGAVDSSLASLYLHSLPLTAEGDELYVCGGGSRSRAVVERVASLWKRRAVTFETGAALGAAASGAWAAQVHTKGSVVSEGLAAFASSFVARGEAVEPRKELVEAYHGAGGYLEAFKAFEKRSLGL